MSTPRASTSSTAAPERSLNRQTVLEEDEYTAALSHIIARDFFPSLVHLDATNEYLDALQSRDPLLINASVRRIQDLSETPLVSRRPGSFQTPSQTPFGAAGLETPLRTPHLRNSDEPPLKKPRYDTDLSLDTFQARYTSEDNSSFTQILDDENRLRKEKWSWAWDAQKKVEAQRERLIEAREKMLIEPAPAAGVRETYRIEAPTSAGLITDGTAGKQESDQSGNAKENEANGLQLVVRDTDQPVDVMAPKKDTRTTVVDGWKFRARNSLMFSPDADESPYHVDPRKLPEVKGPPKTIVHSGTRIDAQEHSNSHTPSASEPPSPTRSRINAAIAGTPYRPRSPANNNFSLVPNVPSPTPSELGPSAVQQLMTWGTLNATPRIISSEDPDISMPPPPNSFRIHEPSAREKLSQRLSNQASKSLRAKADLMSGRTPGISRTPSAGRRSSMGPPSSTPKRSEAAGNLTPAAKRLLARSTMGSKRAEAMERTAAWSSAGSGGKDLAKARWTPTPGSSTKR